MKFFPLLATALLIALAGCKTGEQVRQDRVREETKPGSKRTYEATFNETWQATLVALRRNNFDVLSTNQSIGYIHASRPGHPQESGDNVQVWLRKGKDGQTGQTEVEVLDRLIGPRVLGMVDRELAIHDAIAASIRPLDTRVRETEREQK